MIIIIIIIQPFDFWSSLFSDQLVWWSDESNDTSPKRKQVLRGKLMAFDGGESRGFWHAANCLRVIPETNSGIIEVGLQLY